MFEDGATIGLLEANEEGLTNSFIEANYVREGNELVSYETESSEIGETESFEVRYDEVSGLLNLIDFTGRNSTITDHIIWQRNGIGINRIDNDDDDGGFFGNLPVSTNWTFSGLALMVFYHRKRK